MCTQVDKGKIVLLLLSDWVDKVHWEHKGPDGNVYLVGSET